MEAIGTQFNVRRDPAGTTVSVIEGQVRVSGQPGIVSAGEEATIRQDTHAVKRAPADVSLRLVIRTRGAGDNPNVLDNCGVGGIIPP